MLRVGEKRFDEVLGPVGRAGIADHPAVDVVGNRPETALEVRHLVPDDHVEAEALAGRHQQIIACDCLCRVRSSPLHA